MGRRLLTVEYLSAHLPVSPIRLGPLVRPTSCLGKYEEKYGLFRFSKKWHLGFFFTLMINAILEVTPSSPDAAGRRLRDWCSAGLVWLGRQPRRDALGGRDTPGRSEGYFLCSSPSLGIQGIVKGIF